MIFNCDARHIPLPDKSINCVITSPPYYALRKYDIPDVIWDGDESCEHEWEIREAEKTLVTFAPTGSPSRKKLENIDDEGRANLPPLDLTSATCKKCGAWRGQLGCEPHYDNYVRHLCDIFDEVKRVLRDDGIIFVNISDSYGGSGGDSGKKLGRERKGGSRGIDVRPVGIGQEVVLNERGYIAIPPQSQKFTPKSLLGIPERFMLEMLKRGWILRNKIVWHKPNTLPHSVKDRFTVDWEPIYFFSKKKDYFFDQQFEPYDDVKKWGVSKDGNYYGTGQKDYDDADVQNPSDVKRRIIESRSPLGRNKRCVWKIPTRGVKESHFAIFPDDLVKPMILSGVPEQQCQKCGKPREKVYNSEYFGDYDTKIYKPRPDPRDSQGVQRKEYEPI